MNGYYDGLVVPIIMKYFGPQSWQSWAPKLGPISLGFWGNYSWLVWLVVWHMGNIKHDWLVV